MNDLLALLGKRIHDLRAAKKWSQDEFAHIGSFHWTYVGQIERGEKNMSFDNLAKVADALGVTMSALLDGLEIGTETNVESRGRKLVGGPPRKSLTRSWKPKSW